MTSEKSVDSLAQRYMMWAILNHARLNLVVLRVSDIDRAADFYSVLGLEFSKHAHGKGPQHCASELEGVLIELYPATLEHPISTPTRVGFAVDDVDDVVARLSRVEGAQMVSAPKDSEWGRRAVVADPGGHRVELVGARVA